MSKNSIKTNSRARNIFCYKYLVSGKTGHFYPKKPTHIDRWRHRNESNKNRKHDHSFDCTHGIIDYGEKRHKWTSAFFANALIIEFNWNEVTVAIPFSLDSSVSHPRLRTRRYCVWRDSSSAICLCLARYACLALKCVNAVYCGR